LDVPADAVNVAAAEPAGMVTVAGMLRMALLDVSATERAAVAADDSVTVQFEFAPDSMLAGRHIRLLIDGAGTTVTVPPAPVTGTGNASTEAPIALSTVTATVLDGTTVMAATIPVWIAVVFRPYAIQVYAPGVWWQEMDLPASRSAGPAAAEILTTAAELYASVHCMPATAGAV
jgi:hypothetical protein